MYAMHKSQNNNYQNIDEPKIDSFKRGNRAQGTAASHSKMSSTTALKNIMNSENIKISMDAKVWGPHYWFVLFTMASCYPKNPNDVTKKKYYEFIQNLPLFMPTSDFGNSFSKLLDTFPVTPYLDSRDSFIKWTHFIHNRINFLLGKEEITLHEALERYYDNYKTPQMKIKEKFKHWQKIVFLIIIFGFFLVIKYSK
jgi:hypothetical protein